MKFKARRTQFLVRFLHLPSATGVPDARWERFQLDYLEDTSRFRIDAKSRQIAFSWIAAAAAVADALLDRQDTIFSSINLEEAKEKIRYARQVYDTLQMNPDTPTLPKLARENMYGLEFDNGARLTSLPARPPRGRARSNVVLDEFAHVQHDRQIYTAALPIISKGGRLRVGSSPFGASGVFWEVYGQALRPYPGYRRVTTPWWAVQAFCTHVADAQRLAPTLPTSQRVERFGNERIQAIYANMPEEDFQQEYECHLARTEVLLADGSRRKFIDLDIGDELVYNNDGTLLPCKITNFRRVGVRKIVRLTTEAGTVLSASSGHQVKTRQGRVSIDGATELGYVFGLPRANSKEKALARLVGHNLGDGTIARRKTTYTKRNGEVSAYYHYQASFYSATKQDLETIVDDLVTAGLAGVRRPNVLFKKGREPKYDAYQVHVSRNAADALLAAGCVAGKKPEQVLVVPDWIRNGDKSIQVEFLAALFGAEGNTPRRRAKPIEKLPQSLYLKMHSKSESNVFLEQVLEMLRSFGVRGTLTRRNERGIYAYTILVHTDLENALTFFGSIGYRHARRKEEAAFLWRYYLMAYRHEGVLRKREALALREKGLSYAQIARQLGISTQGAHNLVNKEIKRSSWGFPTFDQWITDRYHDGTLYLRIIGKEDGGEEEVFNITVDSPDHSYLLADGLDNYNCDFVDETSAWITWEEIKDAQDSALACERVACKDGRIDGVADALERLRQATVTAHVEEAFGVGVDIGRTRNTTEIHAVGLTTLQSYPLRLMISLDNMPFDPQRDALRMVLDTLPVVRMTIDQTGIGRNLAEDLAHEYPGKVEGVDFTQGSKLVWATDAKMLIQKGKTPLPVDRDLAYQIHSIKRIVTPSRNLVFDADRNEKHHADKFWAWALALASLRSGAGLNDAQLAEAFNYL